MTHCLISDPFKIQWTFFFLLNLNSYVEMNQSLALEMQILGYESFLGRIIRSRYPEEPCNLETQMLTDWEQHHLAGEPF